ncbi:pyridoxal phosphate-dependent decarboxylase family protein [Streptomyces sp. NPDC058001]|uniref:pyridoxal phosphate-dependent decarboxylase family protein n=1 Tax=Streptomyces sp. NPDC058001 TaxID=3346300 RepID=UPI0036ECF4CE
MSSLPPLAGGVHGPVALRPLVDTVLDALRDGAEARGGPLPRGGPDAVAHRVREVCEPLFPERGIGDDAAVRALVRVLAEGAADPAEPLCAAHLHCPPLAVATAADLAVSALNPSLDSWDQAPAASELETLVVEALAAEVYGTGRTPAPGGIVTTGGTEANQLALLLGRETLGPVQVVCGGNSHHSVARGAWMLGLPPARVLPTPRGVLDPDAVTEALDRIDGPALVVATGGTTDAGLIDPLPRIADLCAAHGARFHVDAAYGGGLLFSDILRPRVDGIARADTVTLDLHKLGWQPVAAGLLTVRAPGDLDTLAHQADYLNADDDTEAGLPDLLGRSPRTTRRPDILKIAVTLKALGRTGLATLVDQVCAHARDFADLVAAHPAFDLYAPPTISTVLFRPRDADDDHIASVRRTLLDGGHAVLGRARADGRLWLKATLLNPHIRPGDLTALLNLVEGHTPR